MSTDEFSRAGGRVDPISYEDRLAIATPEGVEVELTLAGIGSRFIAGGIDFTIQLAVIISLALITQPAGDAGAALFTSAMFALIFFYDVLFEVLGRGRTPGKRWTGLRVVRSGGRPITLARSSVRNILRIIDILPGFYAVGMTVIFITPRNQRIGDLAAGSHVVRPRHGDRRRVGGQLDADPGPAAMWDVTAVSQDDVAAVRAFLERRFELQGSTAPRSPPSWPRACVRASAGRRPTSRTRASSSCWWRRRRPGARWSIPREQPSSRSARSRASRCPRA